MLPDRGALSRLLPFVEQDGEEQGLGGLTRLCLLSRNFSLDGHSILSVGSETWWGLDKSLPND